MQQKIKLPTNWSEIAVKNYLGFKMSSDVLEQIAFLCGLDCYDNSIMTLTFKDISNIKKSLKWMQEVPTRTPEILTVNDTTYYKKPLNEINVFEWRSYDYYTREPEDNYISHLMAVMYQKNGEAWGYDLNKRSEIFQDVTMDYWGVAEWIRFKQLCFEKYPLASDTTPTEDTDEEETYQMRARRLEAERQQKIQNSLNWEKIMLSISNNSAKESYEAMNLPVLYVFRIITLQKEQ